MKRYVVNFEPEAKADVDDIFAWIAEQADPAVAESFIKRLEAFCMSLDRFPMRGVGREDLAPRLRLLTFEQAVHVAYLVGDDRVDILRLAYRGLPLEGLLR